MSTPPIEIGVRVSILTARGQGVLGNLPMFVSYPKFASGVIINAGAGAYLVWLDGEPGRRVSVLADDVLTCDDEDL